MIGPALQPGPNAMPHSHSYDIALDVKHGFLELIDIAALAKSATSQWSNRTLCAVNDCVVRLGVVQGEFHWHKHDREDEFFLVIEGELSIDLEDGATISLKPNQGYAVPRGRVHRTRASERTVILMVEGATVTPTGDE
jgi:mannose-6-phosphate isomerase-like protein (cupin superfamily)